MFRVINKGQNKMIKMYMPRAQSLLSPIEWLSTQEVTFKFNEQLFNVLCIRNFDGKATYNQLYDYAIAYQFRRYTTQFTVIE